ncbi:PREDICTED: Fanconi anemia core complex-associated protein 20 isoform X1 [Gavialis gangeticus]|uniref:Fanconi anemia core complex-associated protein 20 isoform X1 n=2 Tax=Gavialis gangeticus TaxID=94835 RepID=UPI00092E62BA|nr:PREDICTED: Fanconi anemia core complex-associated protein 20 isoform X1 [Gavialis gangeticus]
MADAGAAKLRLKARKAPPSSSREPPPQRQTLPSRTSWLEQEGLTASENMWMLLLKAVNPDLKPTSWKMVPSLPEFLGKCSENKKPPNPEVFKVGIKDFQWMPYPAFCREKPLKAHDPSFHHQVSGSQTDHLMTGEDQTDKIWKSVSPTVEKTSLAATEDPIENLRIGDSTRNSSKTKEEKTEACKLTEHTYSTLDLTPAPTKSLGKDFSLQQVCKKSAKSKEEYREEKESKRLPNVQKYQQNVTLDETSSTSLEIKLHPTDIPRMEGPEEKAEGRSQRTVTLDSCPMCQIQFSGMLSQLDIDGHLAKCLSESADDVIW